MKPVSILLSYEPPAFITTAAQPPVISSLSKSTEQAQEQHKNIQHELLQVFLIHNIEKSQDSTEKILFPTILLCFIFSFLNEHLFYCCIMGFIVYFLGSIREK